MEQPILKKGESLEFLGYTIKNSLNDDGLVLSRESEDAQDYETHLGNYGDGENQIAVENAKKAALLFYMLARPEIFAHSLLQKIMRGSGSGIYHEYYLLKRSLEKDGYKMPEEIDVEIEDDYSARANMMIFWDGKPLQWTMEMAPMRENKQSPDWSKL